MDKEAWQCRVYRQRGRAACSAPQLRTTELDEIMAKIFTKLARDKKAIIDALISVIKNTPDEHNYERDAEKLKIEIEQINAKKDRLLEMSVEGAISISEFKSRNDALNEQILTIRDDMLYRLFGTNASEDTTSNSAGAKIVDSVSADLITSHRDIEITNEWISKDFGYTVLFGSLKDDPQQGVAVVIPTGDQEDKNVQKILTPEKHGAIKAESLGAKASILDVVAEDGYRWVFNVYNGFESKQ